MIRERSGEHNKTGTTGELIVRKWLKNKGFLILADNFQRPWGEIDIVAKKGQMLHFVEVKAISYKSRVDLELKGGWRPEENVHRHKLEKLARIIDTWLRENRWTGEWQIDVVAVKLVPSEKLARVKCIENVILE